MKASIMFALAAILAVSIRAARDDQCQPDVNCKLPHCRCWDDPNKPGNVQDLETPQMILLTFSYALNQHTVAPYLSLFENLTNPNGCPAKGTFFAQYNDTSTQVLSDLHQNKHEVAITASNTKQPKTTKQWRESLFVSSEKLYDANIDRKDINGVLAPSMFIGGDNEMEALRDLDMNYEASCVMGPVFDNKGKVKNVMWPFSHDFTDENTPKCNVGHTPQNSYRDIWQFIVPELFFKNKTCSSLSSCSPIVKNKGDAFTLFFETYQRHYYGDRSPLVLFIDPRWTTVNYQMEGLKQFLRVVSPFKNTWILTMSQALEWIKYPVPMYPSVEYIPWGCGNEVKEA